MKIIRHDKKFILLNINTELLKKKRVAVLAIISMYGAISMTSVTRQSVMAKKSEFYQITIYTTEKRYKAIVAELSNII